MSLEKLSIAHFEKFEYIFWDWNGTIINDTPLNQQLMNEQLAQFNLPPLSKDRYREIFGFPLSDFYARAGFDLKKNSFDVVSLDYMLEYERRKFRCALHGACVDVIQAWHKSHKKQSVLSAYPQNWLEHALAHYELISYFERTIGASNHRGDGKIGTGQKLISELKIEPEKIVMVGDTTHDAEVAAALGIACVLIVSGNQNLERLQATGAAVFRVE